MLDHGVAAPGTKRVIVPWQVYNVSIAKICVLLWDYMVTLPNKTVTTLTYRIFFEVTISVSFVADCDSILFIQSDSFRRSLVPLGLDL